MDGCTPGIQNDDRVVQIIKRDAAGNDLVVLDVLSSEREGAQGITLGEDMSGFYKIPITVPRKSWAYQEGSTPSNLPRKNERLPIATLVTRGHSQAAFEAVESLLWSVIDETTDVFWRQYDAHGNWRELKIRLVDTPDDKTKTIIGKQRHKIWKIPLLSWDPFWYGLPIVSSLSRSQMTNTGGTTWEGVIEASNPCDQAGYPIFSNDDQTATEQWTLPDGDASLDTPSVTVPLPALDPGSEFLMNTYPDQLLEAKGLPMASGRMRVKTFEHPVEKKTPIPRYWPVKLVGGSASSRIEMLIPQRHDRPFG